MKPIEELRAAHAATTQGEWAVKQDRDHHACNSKVLCDKGYVVAEGYSSPSCKIKYNDLWAEAEGNTNFIALAHNEFPAMLDEIERLRKLTEQLEPDAQADAASVRRYIEKGKST